MLSAISDPNIALILLVLGALGHLCGVLHSRHDLPRRSRRDPGAAGLSALSVLPINWLGAALLILAFAFFVLEAKFATHGVLAAGGAVCMVLGAVMLIDSPLPEMRIHLSTAIALALPFAAITVFLAVAGRARAREKVVTGDGGHDRRDRRRDRRPDARRPRLRARRILECGGSGAGRHPASACA